jgi:hypothetical protein
MGVVQHSRPREVSTSFPLGRRAIWVTWERHRRTRELCRAFGIELHELSAPGPRLLRHPLLLLHTCVRIAAARPDIVFVQCPSILLGVWAGMLKRIFGFTYVADLHNEAVEPFNYAFAAYHRMLAWIARLADLCIVTNDALKAVVEQRGGRAFVLPDRIPAVPAPNRTAPEARRPYVLFVCSYSPDEPYREVFRAAAQLGDAVEVYVTGNPRGMPSDVQIPANVHLTGFLPTEEYEELLRGAEVVVDLTQMENCLVCGAYEAVAVERPLVTSDTQALRAYFSRGTVYAKHTPEALAAAIMEARTEKMRLAAEMHSLKSELSARWSCGAEQLRQLLEQA